MMHWLIAVYVPWPIINLIYLVKSLVRNEDIGFVFYVRWMFRVDGPYDLILSDFFSRLTSTIIVGVTIIIATAIMIYLDFLLY